MNQSDLNEARTNPEFLKFLKEQEENGLKEKSIGDLYQVLDTLLVLDLDEDRIHRVYQEILKISFDSIEQRLENNKKLTLEGDDIYFIRSFYEHAIEKWSRENYDGAKELFFILSQIVEDSKLIEAFSIHLINCINKIDMDSFYDSCVDLSDDSDNEIYGYFITQFKFNKKDYLDKHTGLLEEHYEQLKHLLN